MVLQYHFCREQGEVSVYSSLVDQVLCLLSMTEMHTRCALVILTVCSTAAGLCLTDMKADEFSLMYFLSKEKKKQYRVCRIINNELSNTFLTGRISLLNKH